jgi:site-specific DNA-cytosine methylase
VVVAGTVTGAEAHNGNSNPISDNLVLAFTERTRDGGRNLEWQEQIAYALDNPGEGGRAQTRLVALGFSENQRAETRLTNISRQITAGGGKPGQGYPAAFAGDQVRRLTPTECERLQGFPHGWTKGHADSSRYRMLGNAICVPVAEWIGRRILR